MSIVAVNKKHQSALNKAYKALRKYHELVNQESDLEPLSKAMERLEASQERYFNDYLEIFEGLPVHEQNTFNSQHKQIHGYS